LINQFSSEEHALALVLEKEFHPEFTAHDLVNLPTSLQLTIFAIFNSFSS
jgi:hypothetical protein